MNALDVLAASCGGMAFGDLTKPGVYLLIRGEQVVYIGQSKNMLSRIGAHSRVTEFDRVLFFVVKNRRRRLAIEGAFLRRFDPPESTAGPKTGGERDAAILKQFGLKPDPVATAAFIARQDARWTTEARARAGESIRKGWRIGERKRQRERARRLIAGLEQLMRARAA